MNKIDTRSKKEIDLLWDNDPKYSFLCPKCYAKIKHKDTVCWSCAGTITSRITVS